MEQQLVLRKLDFPIRRVYNALCAGLQGCFELIQVSKRFIKGIARLSFSFWVIWLCLLAFVLVKLIHLLHFYLGYCNIALATFNPILSVTVICVTTAALSPGRLKARQWLVYCR